MRRITPMVYAACFTAALLPLIYMVVWYVLTGPFSADLKSLVIGTVVGTVLGTLTQFWLGTSASSARKNEVAEARPPGA